MQKRWPTVISSTTRSGGAALTGAAGLAGAETSNSSTIVSDEAKRWSSSNVHTGSIVANAASVVLRPVCDTTQ